MTVETGIYRDLAYIFAAALAGGLLARQLRQPLVIGYVLSGIVVGPFTPGPKLTGAHTLDLLAEIGVILLMYSIGIEFAPRDLAQVKGVALVGGPIGIALNILLAVIAGYFLGWGLSGSVAIGAILCVASTMVMSRLLIERRELTSLHGRIMIGVTLVEDLAVVVMTVLLPALGSSSSEGRLGVLARDISKALVVLIPLIFLAMRWVPSLMIRIARMRNPELYVLVVLALGLTTAAITQTLGLSLALGAFAAGMIVSDTEVAHETLQRLQPLRDAFAALFFVTVGALIDPRALLKSPGLLTVLVGLIVIGKLVVWSAVVRLFGYPNRTAILTGVGLTQIGEFSYVLVQVAQQERVLGDNVYNAVLAASLVSILLNAVLFRWAPSWIRSGPRECPPGLATSE